LDIIKLKYFAMKTTVKLLILLSMILWITPISSQEIHRDVFRLPGTVTGYQVLKCDFHLHTIFSDGAVWPVYRVEEAYAEGLDVISITDHIESRPRIKEMGVKEGDISMNMAYNLAKEAAKKSGIILIPGAEITKEVPPGHFNVLFIQDADLFRKHFNASNPRDGSFIRGALAEARKQGAFIIWNHPWYQTPDNTSTWFPVIDSLYNEGYIDGIEVVNATRYDPVIFGWAQDKKLANLANTDAHSPVAYNRKMPRTMTIVFAKERTPESIKEALKERRSVSYCNDSLYGDKTLLEALFHASIDIKTSFYGKECYLSVFNNTSLPFEIKFADTGRIKVRSYSGGMTVPAKGETAVRIVNDGNFSTGEEVTINIKVMNLETAPGIPLHTTLVVNK
jgi:predicted metal-dependent phosphoesterase TrpH